jgi:hydrogenase maturation protease
MNWERAEAIADAILHEGYLLYPYRRSAPKNRYRWQFGIVRPQDAGQADEYGPAFMQTECLVEPGASPSLDLKLRFLQIEARLVERLAEAPDRWEAVDAITVGDRELVTWDEAEPREVAVTGIPVCAGLADGVSRFAIGGSREVELVRDASHEIAARIVRERLPITGVIEVSIDAIGELRKVRVRVTNDSTGAPGGDLDRRDTLRRSLIGAHTLLAIADGAFVSLLEPPLRFAEHAAGCTNAHTWPVLVGQPPERDLMLSSPIILYDYPAVAAESPGDLFDATEIDEMLTLRVLTLTERERQEAIVTDPRAKRIIERATTLPDEMFGRLHGAMRDVRHETMETPDLSSWEMLLNPTGGDAVVEVNGVRLGRGSRVRLRALSSGGRRTDAMDMFLVGQPATVAAVYRDLEDQAHIAVTIDASGAADLHESNGRYFYFRADEIEVLDDAAPGKATTSLSRNRRVLVAGIGNIFLGDDGFGPAVIQRLASRSLPDGVRVEDFGIRGIHLAYEMLGASPQYETTIIIDAVARGAAPGTLFVLEPDVADTPIAAPDAHSLSVEGVLQYLAQVGGHPCRVVVVGCEHETIDSVMGLSESVAAAVDGAADLVLELLADEGA